MAITAGTARAEELCSTACSLLAVQETHGAVNAILQCHSASLQRSLTRLQATAAGCPAVTRCVLFKTKLQHCKNALSPP